MSPTPIQKTPRLALVALLSLTACAPFAGSRPDAEEAFPGRSGELRHGFLLTFPSQVPISFLEVDGQWVMEGDILLDQESVVPLLSPEGAVGARRDPVAAVLPGKLWPEGIVPYRLHANLLKPERVANAIARWERQTSLTFVPRTAETDFVTFRDSTGCSATVGRKGGEQFINLAVTCSEGSTVHEIGHAIGMYHEQARTDREGHVLIHWANVEPGKEHNFQTYEARALGGVDLGSYDVQSIMHYGSSAFSTNGQPTITLLDGSTFSSNRAYFTAGDLAGVEVLYGPPQDRHPPQVSIASPQAGATVRGTVGLVVLAQDEFGVEKVALQLSDTLLGELLAEPYALSWDTTTVPDGNYILTATATDAAGNAGVAQHPLTVRNLDGSPPHVTLLLPWDGVTVKGTVTFSANATDDFGVVGVEFTVDDEVVGKLERGPWKLDWDSRTVANGGRVVKATARDAAGNLGTSLSATVQVNNPEPVLPQVPTPEPAVDPPEEVAKTGCAAAPGGATFGGLALALLLSRRHRRPGGGSTSATRPG